MESVRRDFLKKIGGLTAAWAASPLLGGLGLAARSWAGDAVQRPTLPTGRFEILINGYPGGHPSNVEGAPKSRSLALAFGPGMSRPFYGWLESSLRERNVRGKVSVLDLDFNYKPVSGQDYFGSLLSELRFPALDASSKEPVFLNAMVTAEETRRLLNLSSNNYAPKKTVSPLLGTEFRLSIQGLDCSRVRSVGAIAVNPANIAAGDFPTFSIRIPEADEGGFTQWAGNGQLKYGELDYLNSMGQSNFTLKLSGLRLLELTPSALTRQEAIRWVEAKMSCRQVAFDFSYSAVG